MRFSMRSLLLVVTAVAMLTALANAVGWLGITLLVATVFVAAMPVCFGTLALYCRGLHQTFFLGALVGGLIFSLSLHEALLGGFGRASASILVLLFDVVGALACGFLAVATRRFAERRGWTKTPGEGVSESAD